MDDLLQAVEQLADPVSTQILQDVLDPDGHHVRDANGPRFVKSKVVLPSLLDQLDTAIRSSMRSGSGPGGLPSERNVLDSEALFRAVKIATTVSDWCRSAGVRPLGTSSHQLRQWYASTLSQPLTEASTVFHLSQMRAWAAFIRGHLDPPREHELPDACPSCGSVTWWRSGLEYAHPLVVRFREGPDMVLKARAHCRACDESFAVRELAWALEHADTPNV